MLVRRLSQLLTATVLAVAFVALTGVAGGSVAKAQGRYYNNYRYRQELRQREALRRHYLRERFLFGNPRPWRRDWRDDRFRYHSGYDRYPYYRRW